jgi:hypothetical protein
LGTLPKWLFNGISIARSLRMIKLFWIKKMSNKIERKTRPTLILALLSLVIFSVECTKKSSNSTGDPSPAKIKVQEEKNLCLLKATGDMAIGELKLYLEDVDALLFPPKDYVAMVEKFESCAQQDEHCLVRTSNALLVKSFVGGLEESEVIKYAHYIHEVDSCEDSDITCFIRTTAQLMSEKLRMRLSDKGEQKFSHLFNRYNSCLKTDKDCLIEQRSHLVAKNFQIHVIVTGNDGGWHRMEAYQQCFK